MLKASGSRLRPPLRCRAKSACGDCQSEAQSTSFRLDRVRKNSPKVRSGDPDNFEVQGARRYWAELFGKGFRKARLLIPTSITAIRCYARLRPAPLLLRACTPLCGQRLNRVVF